MTQPANNLSVTINSSRGYRTGYLYIQSFSLVLHVGPLTLRAIPYKVRCGISGNLRKIPGRYHLVSARLRNFVKVSGCTGFALMQKMLLSERQRVLHFLYQRKNLYLPILGRIFLSEPDSDANHRRASTLELFNIPHRTLSGIVWKCILESLDFFILRAYPLF